MNGVFESFTTRDEKTGLNRLVMAVEGVHCAACIQKIEKNLHARDDVAAARLNFSTRRLTVEWPGTAALADDLAAFVTGLGFKVAPFDPRSVTEGSSAAEKNLLICMAVAGFAAGNIMMISIGLWASTQEIMGLGMRDFLHWMEAVVALPAIAYAGRPFFGSAWGALKEGHANMDVPISLALLLASGMSLYETMTHGEHAYFDSATMLMFFLLIGRYLDMRARRSARRTATDLMASLTGTATVLDKDGTVRLIPVSDIEEGLILSIAAGEKIAADGIVLGQGESEIDTSLITGETLPRRIKGGDLVFAGTINLSQPVRVRVQKAGEDTLLGDIVRLMEKAEQGQARYVRLADKAARLYTPLVHLVAGATFLGWWLMGGLVWQEALLIAITVLIITCPCALGLAVPVVQVLASSRLMKNGVLVKSGDALERLAAIDRAVFDKTGTLTHGRPFLEDVRTYDTEDLKWAASLAVHSKHPLSRAIAGAYDGDLLDLEVREIPGKGLEASHDGQSIRLGRRDWCDVQKADNTHDGLELWLARAGHAPVCFKFSDGLRSDAQTVLAALNRKGVQLSLLSGDRAAAVRAVAERLGVADYDAGLSPVEKYEKLEALKAQGRKVLMVGDGLNDAPVLAGADVSMSPAGAVDIAQNTADIVFMGDRLAPVLTAYDTARQTQKLVKQNFALAILYNIIAVPLAVAGIVTPLIAALAMSGSSLMVVGNSFRLVWSDKKKGS